MQESAWFIAAIVLYLAAMLGIGLWGYSKTRAYSDYTIAGRGLPPFVAALSAGASDMSGWLLMGLPGALFVTGLSEAWIAIGLTAGAWANWTWVAPRLRAYSEVAGNSITMPSFFENRLQDRSHLLRITASLIIIFFFVFYVASGMVAGGRYFEATFDGSYLTGMLIVAAVTIAYTFFGGFLAVSYTDVVQGLLMFSALVVVPLMAIAALDSPADLVTWATTHPYGPHPEGNPTYFNMFAGVSAAVIIGNLAWGLGYFGQPHVLIRFFALRSPGDARRGRLWGISWMALSMLGAVFVAMAATAFFAQNDAISVTDQENFETIFLDMARILFHPLIAGLILTAVLAAIMSTMSSQLLVVSSSLVEDLYRLLTKKKPSDASLMTLSRAAVVLVAIVALALSVHPNDSILGLVAFAWAGFGSAFGPLVVISLYWRRLTTAGALAGMVGGAVTAVAWSVAGLSSVMYEMVPGVAVAVLLIVVVSLLTPAPSASVTEEFDAARQL
ncbi:sodium/proline symporter PutP [Corynebacterium uterequi]|uniref:Sodium/proline symporter n=1 Tax=Corynebacterium uterequi TaxID=1072256 RepID=A0A0G3HBT1_9CORY|nr:sodium/proline symporter PutP [Corynebacterium uterequi]AKK10856.1 sodium/proline symporter [Corynebacterium uterequi]